MRSYGHHHRRKKSSSLFPLVLFSLFLFITGYLTWKYFYTPEGIQDQVQVTISGEEIPSFLLGESTDDFQTISIENLQEGEMVKSKENSEIILTYKGIEISLDKNTELRMEKIRSFESDNSFQFYIFLQKGRVWLNVSRIANPNSEFKIMNANFYLTSRGGEFSFDEEMVAVHLGNATVADLADNTISMLEVEQQILFDTTILTAMDAGGEGPRKTPFSAKFQTSDWYKEKAGIEDMKPEKEETEEEEKSPIQITKPGKNKEEITVSKDSVTIEGTVPKETEKVIINDYALGKFKKGDTTFTYKASEDLENLEKGRNEYEITALLDDGDLKYTTSITIIYDPDAETAEEGEEEPETEESVETPNSGVSENSETGTDEDITGKLKITSHEEGDLETKDLILVKGTAPSNAKKIVVNGYTLSAFSTGDKTWEYRIKDSFGNRDVGEKEIEVVAYDKKGKKIATTSVTIEIEELEEETISTSRSTSPSTTTNTSSSPASTTTNNSSESENENDENYWPEMRGDTLPPVESDDISEPTI